MTRRHNTTKDGYGWSEQTKRAVWNKGSIIPGFDSSIWRRDKCGATMKYSDHGNRNSDYGWEIDHINPVSNGGGDELSNLQPLHWKNNADKADKLYWSC
jgi:hypothetical protein